MTSLSGQLPAGGLKEQLATVFTQIKEAQTLDVNGDELGAYRHYLSSVCLTLQVLSADIQANQGQGTLLEPKVKQLFRMAGDCLERGEDIFSTARKEQRPLALFRVATPSPTISPTLCTPPFAPPYSSITSRSSSSFRRSTFSSSPSPNSSIIPQKLNTPSNSNKVMTPGSSIPNNRTMSFSSSQMAVTTKSHSVDMIQGVEGIQGSLDSQKLQSLRSHQPRHGERKRGVGSGASLQNNLSQSQPNSVVRITSYMEEAQLRNHHMMEQYKSHLRQQYSAGSGRPLSHEAGLSMLRRLEENLSVARIREQNIAKRLKEKRLKEKEAGSKAKSAKSAVTFSSLSVDELCDHVTSFEHGKSRITALKAHLNASESDPSTVYSSISEILSIIDHPLSRLLGEYQYSVYMMLQPVGAAVEKAGGLPRLDIWLDPNTKSSENEPHTAVSGREEAEEADDALLELLGEDQDDMGTANWSDWHPAVADSFDSKLKRVKREITQDDTAEELCGQAHSGSENKASRIEGTDSTSNKYQNVSEALDDAPMLDSGSNKQDGVDDGMYDNSTSNKYQNVSEALDDAPMLDSGSNKQDGVDDGMYDNSTSNKYQNVSEALDDTPMLDSGSNKPDGVYDILRFSNSSSRHENNSHSNPFEPQGSGIYSFMASPPITSKLATDLEDSKCHINRLPCCQNVYEDLNEISEQLEGRERKADVEEGRGRKADVEEGGTHIYEMIDSVFGNKGVVSEGGGTPERVMCDEPVSKHDSVDGGLLSHPGGRTDEIEMNELLVFKNLPPLLCTAHLGDKVVLGELADTAGTVLTTVVKQVHQFLKVLQQCFSSCYPILSSEENQEVCHSVLEASFFPAIISLLTIVYRCKNYKQEVAVAKNMYQQVNASPRDLAVRHKYWLIEQRYAPYGEAIDEVRRLTSFQYPSSKLECVVRMSKHVFKCIEDYCRQYHPQTKVDLVGVDDMLPILSFVILRSGMPQLISECSIMEEFIQEGYIMGEEGFCLTSFLTALRYIVHMSAESS